MQLLFFPLDKFQLRVKLKSFLRCFCNLQCQLLLYSQNLSVSPFLRCSCSTLFEYLILSVQSSVEIPGVLGFFSFNKAIWGRKGFISSYFSLYNNSSWREFKAGTWRQKLKYKPQRNAVSWLAPQLPFIIPRVPGYGWHCSQQSGPCYRQSDGEVPFSQISPGLCHIDRNQPGHLGLSSWSIQWN